MTQTQSQGPKHVNEHLPQGLIDQAAKRAAEAPKTPNIFQRLNEVRKSAKPYIQRLKNVDGKYNVVTHDQVTDETRDHFISHGVIVSPSLVSGVVIQDTMLKTKTNPIIRYESVWDIAFINIDDPRDRHVVTVPAHALDTGDKAPGKACSYATKMAVLKVLNIITGDEEERRVEGDHTDDGLTQNAEADWNATIDALTATDDPEALWVKVKAACEAANDREAATRLRGRISARVQQLRKPKPDTEKKAA